MERPGKEIHIEGRLSNVSIKFGEGITKLGDIGRDQPSSELKWRSKSRKERSRRRRRRNDAPQNRLFRLLTDQHFPGDCQDFPLCSKSLIASKNRVRIWSGEF